ncbi:MAG: hypothetical protein ABSF28_05380 [Terracidiphilus sp.]
MLDEDEYAQIRLLYMESIRATKEFRERHRVPLKDVSIPERFRPVRDEYERLTGMKELHENAIMHHRLSLYGPPCKHCQRPLRTPKAKLCGSCMSSVDES